VIVRLFALVEKRVFASASNLKSRVRSFRYKAPGAIGLYFGVLGFNLFMSFWIGERELGGAGGLSFCR
jgi:hypothetical protein